MVASFLSAASVLGWSAHAAPVRTTPTRHSPPQLMWTAHGRLHIELEAITATQCAFQSCAAKAGSTTGKDEPPEQHAPKSMWPRLPRWRLSKDKARAIETEKRALVLKTAAVAFQFADTDGSGEVDFKEMFSMMQRMVDKGSSQGQEFLEEMRTMFDRFDQDKDGVLTYEEFLLLLTECPTDSALFNGLLSFAEDAVMSGVGTKLRSPSVRALARQQSHVLDDGSMAWRQSIEVRCDTRLEPLALQIGRMYC